MRQLRYIPLVCIVFLLFSCEKIAFSDLGELERRKVSFDYFSKISCYSTFDVVLVSDSVFSVEVLAYSELQELIIVKLDSNCLSITDSNELKWLTGYPRPKLRISFPRLDDFIYVEYPVNMTTEDTLQVPRLVMQSLGKTGDFNFLMDVGYFQVTTGSDNFGSYIFKGRANYGNFWTRGSSRFDASGLLVNFCSVKSNSISDCWVNAGHRLEATLNTSGNIYYSGDPDEIFIYEESGSGRLLPIYK